MCQQLNQSPKVVAFLSEFIDQCKLWQRQDEVEVSRISDIQELDKLMAEDKKPASTHTGKSKESSKAEQKAVKPTSSSP